MADLVAVVELIRILVPPGPPVDDKSCGLNGLAQHSVEVYSQESQNLKSFAGVDLSAALPCPGLLEHSSARS